MDLALLIALLIRAGERPVVVMFSWPQAQMAWLLNFTVSNQVAIPKATAF